MEGAALAAERKFERDLLVAHQGAGWTGAAYAGKLKQFKHYRPDKVGETKSQSAEDILSSFVAMHSFGAPVNIEKVN